MPPANFEYRSSHADGITLSHSIFRYEDIANIYTIFSDWKLYPGEDPAIYDSLFKEIADAELNTAWRMSRQCVDDGDCLVDAIKQLYCGWNGKPVSRYRNYIKKSESGNNNYSRPLQSDVKCKPYWALIKDGQFNQWRITICLDGMSGIDGELVVSSGDGRVAIPCNDLGVTCFQWMENTDSLTNLAGWDNLKSNHKIVFDHKEVRLGEILAFNRCFDGHAAILLQSYVPPSGGNEIWRLMIGSQGADLWTRDNIWQGDGRRNDTRYAVMSPSELMDCDVQCEGLESLKDMGVLTMNVATYHVYWLKGNLKSDLKVKDVTLFNFGIRPDEKRGATEFFVTKELRIRNLIGREFIAPPRLTVFYLPKERKIAVYCPEDAADGPNLYEVSANTIKYCETDPTMRKHQIKDFVFETASGLWITENDRDDNGDEPLAIGTFSEDDGLISFAPVDKAASDYLNSWRGYFLPMLDNVKGAIGARKWSTSIHEVLTASQIDDEGMEHGENIDVTSLVSLLEDVLICDAEKKLKYIREIGLPLRRAVVSGMPNRPGFGCFNSAFQNPSEELEKFLDNISNSSTQLSLKVYFAWALILMSVYRDRVGTEDRLRSSDVNRWNKFIAFKKTLNGFYPNLDPCRRAWYCPRFLCEGIVHAVLDGISDEKAQRIVSHGVALADRIVGQLA